MRNIIFAVGEYYHVYNRGVEKRDLFVDQKDLQRFAQSMKEFNAVQPIGSIFESSFKQDDQQGAQAMTSDALVEFVAFCVNPNHYHFIVRQVAEQGVSKYMHRLGTGYTKYFNTRHERSGALFQGKFKAKHVHSNEYLLYLSAYVNFNDQIHQLGSRASKYVLASDQVYLEGAKTFVPVASDVVMEDFESRDLYKEFSDRVVQNARKEKGLLYENNGELFD